MKPAGLKSYDKKRKRAVFEVIIPGTHSRKRLRKVVTVENYDDCLAKLKVFRDSVHHADKPPVRMEVPTLRAYVDECWETYALRLTTAKRRSNEAILQHHLLPALGTTRIDRITTAHAEDVISAMRKKKHDGKPYSNSYINTILTLLRGLLTHAYRRRAIPEPPFAREKLPLLPEAPLQNELAAHERDHLLAAFENEEGFRDHFRNVIARSTKKKVFRANSEYATYYYDRYRHSAPLFIAAFYTGLRFTDLRFLKWTNVDLKAGIIRLVMRKTKRTVTIPIVARLHDALMTCRKRTVMSEYVFLTLEGKTYSKATIRRYFTIAKAIAGITRRFRFHDQRHTFASILATNGINAFTLRDLLGHTSTRTTERYARPSNETLTLVRAALP
jgi:integrase